MPKRTVEIEWDHPDDTPGWLCADNINIALSAHCKNTKFKVREASKNRYKEAAEKFKEYMDDSPSYVLTAEIKLVFNLLFPDSSKTELTDSWGIQSCQYCNDLGEETESER